MTAAIIEAVSRGCKGTLADGTVRYVIDIGPQHAIDAAELFGMPGSPVALARLTQEAAQASAQAETIAKGERVTGLALLAVQWCKDPEFWKFLNHLYDFEVATNEQQARDTVCEILGIESRREIEEKPGVAAQFNQEIRGPYMLWRQEKGL